MNQDVTIDVYDFGDAPDDIVTPGYPTLSANNGAFHTIVSGVYLGASIDDEVDGIPESQALGDDNTDLDDEDGVIFTSV